MRMFADRRVFNAETGTGAGGEGTGTPEPKWFETDRFTDDHRGYLTAKGLTTVEDPQAAIAKLIGIGQAADRRFGRPIDSVIDKPQAGQDLAIWRRENAATFGLPDAADGYAVDRPEGLPESIAWNADLESDFRKIAFDRGLSNDDVKALTGLYAGHVAKISDAADQEFSRANEAMMADLGRQWGAATDERIAQARQAAQVVGERAGLDNDGIQAVASVLTKQAGGDAAAIRFFAALGQMMGEDKGLGFGAGDSGGMSKEDAKAKLAELRAPGGAFFEAKTAAERQKLIPEIERLTKIVTG